MDKVEWGSGLIRQGGGGDGYGRVVEGRYGWVGVKMVGLGRVLIISRYVML